MPKLSVIVPVYNTEKYLGKCIQSILSQTEKDIEIILIDDSSTDKSLDIMTFYQEQNPRSIKILQTKQNSGPATARNLGLEIATGEYIGFVDSDDFITPVMYEEMITACKETSSDMARVNQRVLILGIDKGFFKKNKDTTFKLINAKTDDRFIVAEPPCSTNKLFKRELIGNERFPEGIKWEDYPFTVPLTIKANQIVSIPKRHYTYNIHRSNTTFTDARMLSSNLLDIFTCSDIIGEKCFSEDMEPHLRYLLEYTQMYHCVFRLKEIVGSSMPLDEKRELLTLTSALIKTKYGPWQEHELYHEQKQNRLLHRIRMNIVESLLTTDEHLPKDEEELKQKIKVKLDKYSKK